MFAVLQQQANPGTSKDHFVSDVISYYIRMGQQPVYFTIYFVKVSSGVPAGGNVVSAPHFSFKKPLLPLQITFTGDKREAVEDVFLTGLKMEFPELSQVTAALKGDLSEPERFFVFV